MGKLDRIEDPRPREGEVVTFPSGAFGASRKKSDLRKDCAAESNDPPLDQILQLGTPFDNSLENTKRFFEPWTIFIISDLTSGFRSHVEWLSGLVPSVELNRNSREVFREISIFKPYSSIAMVDIDTFGDLGRAVQELLEFRKRAPMVPIAIGSRTFKRNDFSSERSAIADSSVVMPATKEELGMAIGAAINNHKARLEKQMFKPFG